ncbi:MAG: radical SAM protein [Selenomonadaceae bacterium]|nr:radical SAM protein [Selenomonadaceae bacterium]
MKAKFENLISKKRHDLSEVIPLDTPYAVYIDVSSICNFRCKFCAPQTSNKSNSYYKKGFMSFELYKKIIDNLKMFPHKLKKINLCCHGEPLLNNRLPDMIDYAVESNVANYIGFATNGSLLTSELNDRLSKCRLTEMKISVEALSDEEYYNMSGVKLNFDEFQRNIRDFYIKKNPATMLSIKIARKVGFSEDEEEVFFNIFGDMCDRIDMENIVQVWPDFPEFNERFAINRDVGIMNQPQKDVQICPFPFHTFVVLSNGTVVTCSADWQGNNVIGKISPDSSNNTLIDIWNGNLLHDFWVDMLEGKVKKYCRDCKFKVVTLNDNIDKYRGIILDKLRLKQNEKLYNDDFYKAVHDTNMKSVDKIVKLLVGNYFPNSVVDVGCGLGIWLSFLKKSGVKDVLGIDGAHINLNKLLIDRKEFMAADLSKQIRLDKKYDLAICLEVAEHIEPQYADSFISNITKLSEVVLFSAAIPGQGGDHHVNEQWPSYWQEKFNSRGYVSIDCIRSEIWDDTSIQYTYRQNILLYIKNSRIDLIQKFSKQINANAKDIVHPVTYMKYKMNLDVMYGLHDLDVKWINRYLKDNEFYSVCIYGIGKIGQCLYKKIKETDCRFKFFVDQYGNKKMYGEDVKYPYDASIAWGVDVMVIASPYHSKEIVPQLLSQKNFANVKKLISVQDFISAVINHNKDEVFI